MSALYKVTHVCIKYCMKCKLRCIKSYAIFLVLHCYTPFVLLRTGFFMTNAFYIDLKNAVSKYIFIPESFVMSCHVLGVSVPLPFEEVIIAGHWRLRHRTASSNRIRTGSGRRHRLSLTQLRSLTQLQVEVMTGFGFVCFVVGRSHSEQESGNERTWTVKFRM